MPRCHGFLCKKYKFIDKLWESEHLEKFLNVKITIKYELHFNMSAANIQKLYFLKITCIIAARDMTYLGKIV